MRININLQAMAKPYEENRNYLARRYQRTRDLENYQTAYGLSESLNEKGDRKPWPLSVPNGYIGYERAGITTVKQDRQPIRRNTSHQEGSLLSSSKDASSESESPNSNDEDKYDFSSAELDAMDIDTLKQKLSELEALIAADYGGFMPSLDEY